MATKRASKQTFGVLVGNRGFFPDILAKEGHEVIPALLNRLGYGSIILSAKDTKYGAVETWADAKKCADLFKRNREKIDGIIVTLPNFGDERGVADTLKMAGLDVPVLVHAWRDDAAKMTIKHRRDSFCGKMSACNNLVQYGIPFSITSEHTMDPATEEFEDELHNFAAICRVVKGIKNCRIGALGARPANFTTVRYSEKLLQESGITVETLDLSEAFGRVGKLKDSDPKVKARVQAITKYVNTRGVPNAALLKMAKFALVVDEWMLNADLNITAVQCWTSMEEFFGVVPCTWMSMLSNALKPSACEVDVCGAVAMHALALAAQTPSALLDWNNNYGADPDKCVAFHCSNLPKAFFQDMTMDYQEIIAGSVGRKNTYGTVVGRIKPGPMTFCRISTFDDEGSIAGYIGEGEFTSDTLKTFGGYGVVAIPDLQSLLHHICENGFEHHVAMNRSQVARPVFEALDNYLGWDLYWHQG
ncbi:MAG TPA: L-fucose/L-arabinose isomerase family protein [Candidatus Hydrogenedentes bacterium]|nr:L-fucose/L-arabinose isomerase family protein [Candidatus Hydrogenedentota bacterium]